MARKPEDPTRPEPDKKAAGSKITKIHSASPVSRRSLLLALESLQTRWLLREQSYKIYVWVLFVLLAITLIATAIVFPYVDGRQLMLWNGIIITPIFLFLRTIFTWMHKWSSDADELDIVMLGVRNLDMNGQDSREKVAQLLQSVACILAKPTADDFKLKLPGSGQR